MPFSVECRAPQRHAHAESRLGRSPGNQPVTRSGCQWHPPTDACDVQKAKAIHLVGQTSSDETMACFAK